MGCSQKHVTKSGFLLQVIDTGGGRWEGMEGHGKLVKTSP